MRYSGMSAPCLSPGRKTTRSIDERCWPDPTLAGIDLAPGPRERSELEPRRRRHDGDASDPTHGGVTVFTLTLPSRRSARGTRARPDVRPDRSTGGTEARHRGAATTRRARAGGAARGREGADLWRHPRTRRRAPPRTDAIGRRLRWDPDLRRRSSPGARA